MTTFTSAAAFVNNIAQYGDKVKAAEQKALKAAALAAVTDIRQEASRYHITRRTGSKIPLKAGFEITGSKATIDARPAGAWKLIEEGAKPHAIAPRRKGRKGKRRPAVHAGKYGVFAHVQHPGTGGPIGQPWEKGVRKARDSGPEAFNEVIRKAVH